MGADALSKEREGEVQAPRNKGQSHRSLARGIGKLTLLLIINSE